MAVKSNDQIIDDHISVAQCKKAVDALLKHAKAAEAKREEHELLPGKEQHVWLVLAVKQMQPEKKLKPSKIPIVHPLVDPRTSPVCLITKDPQREYKDLIESKGIKFISRVVGIEKLKGKFKPFEARRMLLRENGLFLADERVVPLLPKLLGKSFFEAKKQPIPVNLTRKDLKGELERAISSTYMHQNQGTCTSIKVGIVSQSPAQVLANVKTALPAIVKRVKGGWDNVQSFALKTSSSVALPIWNCQLEGGDGGRWNGMRAEEEEEEEGEEDAEGADEGGSEDDHEDGGEDGLSESDGEEDEEMEAPAPPPTIKAGKKRPAEDAPPTATKKVKGSQGKADTKLPPPVTAKGVQPTKPSAAPKSTVTETATISTTPTGIKTATKKTTRVVPAVAGSSKTPAKVIESIEHTATTVGKKSKALKAEKTIIATEETSTVSLPAPAKGSKSKASTCDSTQSTAGPAQTAAAEKTKPATDVSAKPSPLSKEELKAKKLTAGGAAQRKKEKVTKARVGKSAKEGILGKRV